jgi:bidirectional [NiFe] hydrogenase diaphorase subunit
VETGARSPGYFCTPPKNEEILVTAVGSAVKDNRERLLERAMSRHQYSGDSLIEVLHTAQELFGYLSRPLLKDIARKLKLPPSRVLGVATFYHFFSLKPKGEHTFVVCIGTACYVAGALGLMENLERRCAKAGHTTPDGKVSVETARCIGSCGLAPAVIYDGNVMAKVTPAALDTELNKIGAQ